MAPGGMAPGGMAPGGMAPGGMAMGAAPGAAGTAAAAQALHHSLHLTFLALGAISACIVGLTMLMPHITIGAKHHVQHAELAVQE